MLNGSPSTLRGAFARTLMLRRLVLSDPVLFDLLSPASSRAPPATPPVAEPSAGGSSQPAETLSRKASK